MIISLKVEYLLQDSSILLPPTGTPMTGIEFTKRLPCGEVWKNSKEYLFKKKKILMF